MLGVVLGSSLRRMRDHGLVGGAAHYMPRGALADGLMSLLLLLLLAQDDEAVYETFNTKHKRRTMKVRTARGLGKGCC
jgi:hypothetical protein